jgi:hypothetical protein
LTMNDVLVPLKNVGAMLMNIHTLVGAMTHGENTLKHLQDTAVSTGGGRGTTTAGRARRVHLEEERCGSRWGAWEEQDKEAHVQYPCRTSHEPLSQSCT